MKATLVRGTKEQGVFAVRDLSRTGARLVGMLEVFEGEPVQIALDLAPPLVLVAEVTFVDRQRNVVELSFRGVDSAALARIDESIAAVLNSAGTAMVLVVHPVVATSSALERDLARVRVGARVLPSLDGVMDVLDESVRWVGAILAGSLGEAVGPVLEKLESMNVRRVLLFDAQIETIQHPAAKRVDAVLRTPWRWKGLARGLDLPSEDVVTTYDQLVALQMPIGVKKPGS